MVCHIGAGAGYYTAILSMLVRPGSIVHAIEHDEALAAQATENLVPFNNVTVIQGDATTLPIPSCDLIYVSAGVAAPPLSWLATGDCLKIPDPPKARSVKSVWLCSDKAPDETAVAIYRHVWFSTATSA